VRGGQRRSRSRALALAIAAAFAISVRAIPVMAQDTAAIKKHNDYDNGGPKVIIKKKSDEPENKIIIHKNYQ
jgi:hypothetical protein